MHPWRAQTAEKPLADVRIVTRKPGRYGECDEGDRRDGQTQRASEDGAMSDRYSLTAVPEALTISMLPPWPIWMDS